MSRQKKFWPGDRVTTTTALLDSDKINLAKSRFALGDRRPRARGKIVVSIGGTNFESWVVNHGKGTNADYAVYDASELKLTPRK